MKGLVTRIALMAARGERLIEALKSVVRAHARLGSDGRVDLGEAPWEPEDSLIEKARAARRSAVLSLLRFEEAAAASNVVDGASYKVIDSLWSYLLQVVSTDTDLRPVRFDEDLGLRILGVESRLHIEAAPLTELTPDERAALETSLVELREAVEESEYVIPQALRTYLLVKIDHCLEIVDRGPLDPDELSDACFEIVGSGFVAAATTGMESGFGVKLADFCRVVGPFLRDVSSGTAASILGEFAKKLLPGIGS